MSDLSLPRKELGQHWLNDEDALTNICDLAEISSSDTILEIGPGLGGLTELLAAKAKKVIAIELDNALTSKLKKKFEGSSVEVLNQDIRRFDLSSLPSGYKTVANIPYYLTSYLIRLLSQSPNPPSVCVLLIQKEVAERLAARPGQLSLLGVIAQTYWEVSLDKVIKAAMFTPPPKVDSQIVRLVKRNQPLIPTELEKQFFITLKAGFSQRRKTLANNLNRTLKLTKDQANLVINNLGLKPTVRAQELSLDQWQRLTLQLFTDELN